MLLLLCGIVGLRRTRRLLICLGRQGRKRVRQRVVVIALTSSSIQNWLLLHWLIHGILLLLLRLVVTTAATTNNNTRCDLLLRLRLLQPTNRRRGSKLGDTSRTCTTTTQGILLLLKLLLMLGLDGQSGVRTGHRCLLLLLRSLIFKACFWCQQVSRCWSFLLSHCWVRVCLDGFMNSSFA